jgi:hypothetical protein
MNHKLIIILISGLLSASCTVDYEPDILADSDCIVVNSYLQPDSAITVRFYANRSDGNRSEVVPLEGAHVVLTENGRTLYDSVAGSILRLEAYPVAGGEYFIRVRHDDYPAVEAETSIPQPITCNIGVDGQIYTVYDFQFPARDIPLWITCSALFPDTIPVQYGELFTKNALVDNVNRNEGYDLMDVRVGGGYHDGFLRIKPANQPELTGIEFLPWMWRSMIYDGYMGDEIRLIAASSEYDRYNKTLYQMMASAVDGGAEFGGVVYQPVQVYTNIKWGRGIFAGKSETSYFIKYVGKGSKEDEEKD